MSPHPNLPSKARRRLALFALLLFGLATACASGGRSGETKSEVLVLGMIHGGHRTSERYGIEEVTAILRAVEPDFVLCEIPPDRLETAAREFRETGAIAEPRVARFPEYTDALFPLTRELDFEIIPCAGWTAAMAADRSAKLADWRDSRPDESREVSAAQAAADAEIEAAGWSDDPRGIHTQRYDAIVKRGMEPYNRLFNEDLGPGGWDNINAAHWALIADTLERRRGQGKRFLVTFGAWHKYWFLERLGERSDVVVLELEPFLPTSE